MKITDFFKHNKILLLDGATGSQLIVRGLAAGECPELWNITHQKQVQEIARLYFTAGSDAVLTNTFGGSVLKLRDYGLHDRVHELNLAGAKNAIDMKPAGKYVLGSIGPTGKMLEPFGEVTEGEMTNSFRVQAEALVAAGVDGIVLETFLDLRELMCAVNAVKQAADIPFIASMTFSKTPAGFVTIMGNTISEVVAALSGEGAFAVGSNCGNGIHIMVDVGRQFRLEFPDGILWLKPNAGEPVLKDGITCYSETPSDFENHFRDLASLRPIIMGGCCGTDEGHIRAFRRLIDSSK